MDSIQLNLHIIPYIVLVLSIIPISIIDYKYKIIPDTITFSLMAIGLLSSFYTSYITPLDSIIGLLGGGGVLYLVAIFGKVILKKEDSMGGGDIKLVAAFGAFLGIFPVFIILFVASLTALFYLLILKIKGKDITDLHIPFGPFLSLGMVVSLFVFKNL